MLCAAIWGCILGLESVATSWERIQFHYFAQKRIFWNPILFYFIIEGYTLATITTIPKIIIFL